jgi:biotin carboxylase
MAEVKTSKEWLLMLGASADQLFAIRTAQAMGFGVVAVDQNSNSPGFQIADYSAAVSTRDLPALKHFIDVFIAGGYNVSGVLVQGSDIPQIGCSLAAYIGTPSIPMKAAQLSTHKLKMKDRFQECGIPIPWFAPVDSLEHMERIVSERGYPLVLKPVDRSGARGVFYLDKGCDLNKLYMQSKQQSFCGEVMVEEFLPGLQISTETILYQGKGYTPGFADRNYEMLFAYAPNIIENGAWMPSSVTADQRLAVEQLVERAGLSLGVTDGVVKGDVVITPEGPKMIEMATRLSGGDFCESLIPLSCGVNIVETAINIATGRTPDVKKLGPLWHQAVANRYFFPPSGRLIRTEGLEIVRKKEWVKKIETAYKPGDMLPDIKSHADRFGVFVVVGRDREEVEKRISWVYETVKIHVDLGDAL